MYEDKTVKKPRNLSVQTSPHRTTSVTTKTQKNTSYNKANLAMSSSDR